MRLAFGMLVVVPRSAGFLYFNSFHVFLAVI